MPRKYYGQNAEDAVLWSVFEDGYIGTYLDIGALDGVRFSNTYSFEQAGWRGVCVEAHPVYAKFAKANRPSAVVVHAAASDKDADSINFYANKLGSLSTLDPGMEKHFKAYGDKIFMGFKKIRVPMCTANTVLENANIDKLDVVSIDVEGSELAVLRGLDLNRFSPRILVIESMLDKTKVRVVARMKASGYCLARSIGNNYFYCRDSADITTVKHATTKVAVVKTPHPIRDKK